MDEEAQKRNTDCVYFLASPLTCKKGNSCEFRHSEAARMNPRDCWYWIHSTCRNPNCSFRHPPLEGKPVSSLPPQVSGTAAATVPPASTASMPAAALSSKSKTPCYFFSQGQCAKGDKCSFMHGPSLPSSTDAATQQKPPKAPHAEAGQASNKPVVVLKGYSSNAAKQTSQENSEKRSVDHNDTQPISSKAPTISIQEAPQAVKELERTRVPESSVTSNPYRNEKVPGSRKSRVTLFSDTPEEFLNSVDKRHDMRGPAEKVRQGHPGRKQHQQSQHENERPHSLQATSDHRYQNGSKSDVWWKNESSSLDGDGSDQSIQREDGEYSPRQGSRGRVKVFDDSTGYALKTSKSYAQGGSDSAPLQHRQPRYQQHREQQMRHASDYNGSTDHTRQHGLPSSARTSARDGQRMLSEGYTSSVDLRDHLLKRRRDDRGHYPRSESLPRRGPLDVVDTPHINQRRDDNLIQHDQQGRATYRRADYRGVKRPRHDGGASPDGRPRGSPIKRFGPGKSPDRALSLGSPNRHPVLDYSRGEDRERGRDRYPSKADPISDVRSHLTSSKSVRSEYSKEDSGFTGPKSLAQIKAEKMGESECDVRVEEGRSHKGKYVEGSEKFVDARSLVPTKSQDSTAPTSRLNRSRADSTSVGKRESSFDYNAAISEDFEGPKPLSMLLKEKQKMEPGNSVEEVMALTKKTMDSVTDLHREMEDGEVRDEEDEWKDDHSHYTDSPSAPLQEEVVLRSRLASDSNMEETLEEGHSQGVDEAHEDMGSSEDEMRLGVEIGQTMSGDEDYGLDDEDDDDDFAKKLGGFFS